MKTFISAIFVCLLFMACEQDKKGFYDAATSVYFPDFTSPKDSMNYSFLGKTVHTATIELNVRLLGNKYDSPRNLKLKVDAAATTAQEGVHFQALPPYFELGTDDYDFKIPVVLFKHEDLDEKEYSLTVGIEETEDVKLAYKANGRVTILFSNLILKPLIWDAVLAPTFGSYSKTKHRICMEIMERPFPDTKDEYDLNRNEWRNLAWKCNEYFKENIVMDTDQVPSVRIMPWM